ncbi:hypothetical protein RCJ22_37410 [Vibrio sp. FNV 38]|nr:hypothetical protein [Vibrio sp. FNV 38]
MIVYLFTAVLIIGLVFGVFRLYQIRQSLERQVIQNMDIILLLRTQNAHLEQLKREV